MKHVLLLLSLIVINAGCIKDYGEPSTKNYPIKGNYTALEARYGFQVTVSDQVTDAVITVGELAHDKVRVEVTDGKLYIGFENGTLYSGKAKAVIPVNPSVSELDLHGASFYDGDLTGEDVEIELSGASRYQGHVVADKLDIDLSGASTAELNGKCKGAMILDLSGASTLRAADLEASVIVGEMSGASTAYVTCSDRIAVDLTGASTLTYSAVPGTTPVNKCTTSGDSEVKTR